VLAACALAFAGVAGVAAMSGQYVLALTALGLLGFIAGLVLVSVVRFRLERLQTAPASI
jgi:hypothetical protein